MWEFFGTKNFHSKGRAYRESRREERLMGVGAKLLLSSTFFHAGALMRICNHIYLLIIQDNIVARNLHDGT